MPIEYTIDCPECANGSKIVGQDDGTLSCVAGLHKFASLDPLTLISATAPPVQDLDAPPANEPAPDPVHVVHLGHAAERLKPAADEFIEQARESGRVVEDIDASQAAAPAPTLCQVEVDSVEEKNRQAFLLAEGEALKLPGGDVLVCVRIPESVVQPIAAAAEGSRQTFAQYFQERFTFGAENGWFV